MTLGEEIATLYADGKTIPEIMDELEVAKSTVKVALRGHQDLITIKQYNRLHGGFINAKWVA